MSVIALPHSNDIFIPSLQKGRQWWRTPGTATSVLLHGLFIAAVFGLSQKADPLPIAERTIELVMARSEPPPAPPKPKVEQPPPEKKAAPPKPVPAQRVAPVAAEPVKPVAEATPQPVSPPQEVAPPAPPSPPAPRVISNDGIPSDYVNQVFSRINAKASYPRTAKLRGEEGRIVYKLKLSPSGELLGHEIKSSGNQVLDDAAVAAIKAAAPFPKLPDLGGSAYVLTGSIVFALS